MVTLISTADSVQKVFSKNETLYQQAKIVPIKFKDFGFSMSTWVCEDFVSNMFIYYVQKVKMV